MNYSIRCFILLILFSSYSCSFNKRFHKPSKISIGIEEISFYNFNDDTTYIDLDLKKQEVFLFNTKKQLINEKYSIENEFFKSSNGNLLHAWRLKPKNKKPLGTILHFHGSAINILFHYKNIAPLAELGFEVFSIDYSGYGFSEGKSSRKTALEDAYSALEYLKNQSGRDQNKPILYGQSYGGYLAAIVGSNNQNDIRGIVIEGAFYSHQKEAKISSPIFGNLVKEGVNAKNEIRKNKLPLLIIHSKEDQTVPFHFGEELFHSANSPKELYPIDKGHINGLQYYSEEIFDKIVQLMSK